MKYINSFISDCSGDASYSLPLRSAAASAVNPHFTPMSLKPLPFASASSASEVAGIYWLPDYLGKNISRGSSDDVGGGDIVKDDSDCMEHYNLYATCPSPKLSTGVVHPVAGMTCQKGCICPSEYQIYLFQLFGGISTLRRFL